MKHTRLMTFTAATLLLILLLPFFAGCGSTQDSPAAELPEGWETVSTEGNVTHIRMKEGENTPVWMDFSDSAQLQLALDYDEEKQYRDVPYDPNGTVSLTVYFGHGQIGGSAVHAVDEEFFSPHYALQMHTVQDLYVSFDEIGLTELCRLPDVTETPNIQYRSGDSGGSGQIGYTNAMMIDLPMSIFENTDNKRITLLWTDILDREYYSLEFYVTHDDAKDILTIEHFPDTKEEYLENHFPRVLLKLFTGEGLFYLTCIAAEITVIVFAILTAIKQSHREVPYLILVGILILSLIVTFIESCRNTGPWDFSILIFVAALLSCLRLALISALLQIGTRLIMKRKARKQAQSCENATADPAKIPPKPPTDPQ